MKLDPNQQKVVDHDEGPALVHAVAGAGKTRAIVERGKRLLADHPKAKVLVVTFSRSAADEVRSRIGQHPNLTVATAHSIAYKQLGSPKIDEYRYKWIVDRVRRDLKVFEPDLDEVLTLITKTKSTMVWSPPDSIARVFAAAERERERQGIMTFDDLLWHAANEQSTIRWDFVLQDEAQDQNEVQEELIRSCVNDDYHNYMAVGDPWQCIPKGQKVKTPNGWVEISKIRTGDQVTVVCGGVEVARGVEKTVRSVRSKVIEFKTTAGVFKCTPNHIIYTRFDLSKAQFRWVVYLMWRHDIGFRIGITRGYSNNRFAYSRAQQEGAEGLWVISTHVDKDEALYQEEFLSLKYGLMTKTFNRREGELAEEWRTRLFAVFGCRGRELLRDLGYDFELPAVRAKATGSGRVAVNILQAGRIGSEVAVESAYVKPSVRTRWKFTKADRPSRKGTWRLRRWFPTLYQAEKFAGKLVKAIGTHAYVARRLGGLGKYGPRPVQAAQVHVGMELAWLVDGELRLATVTSRKEFEGEFECFDLQVEKDANFVVQGAVVHNCVFGFRGAAPHLISQKVFERRWKGSSYYLMNLNYRSLPAIVQAADNISEKRAVASRNGSPGVFQTRTFETTIAEANDVAHTGFLATQEESNLNGIAVLYRRHSQAGVLEAALHQAEVPFTSEVPYATLHNIAPLFSYLWLAAGRGTVNDVKKSLNTPFRFIKAEVGEMLGGSLSPPPTSWVEHLQRLDVPARANDWAQLVDRLALLVENEQPPVAIVKTLLVGLGRDTKHHSLLDVATFYTDIHDLLDQMCEGNGKKKTGSKITLSTTHAAKGKEWPLVFFVGYDPVGAAEDGTGEKKRLNYVAFTRAMDALYVSKIEKSEDD